MKVKNESEVPQSCPTGSDPMDCSLPGSSVHGIFQARVLEWGAIALGSQMHSLLRTLDSPQGARTQEAWASFPGEGEVGGPLSMFLPFW